MHRVRDILDLLHADIFECERQLPAYGAVYRLGYADAARFREPFQARRHVHPIAVDAIAVDDHFAEIDADAEPHL